MGTTTKEDLVKELQKVGFTYRVARRVLNELLAAMKQALKVHGELNTPLGRLVVERPVAPKRAYRLNKIVRLYSKTKVRLRKVKND